MPSLMILKAEQCCQSTVALPSILLLDWLPVNTARPLSAAGIVVWFPSDREHLGNPANASRGMSAFAVMKVSIHVPNPHREWMRSGLIQPFVQPVSRLYGSFPVCLAKAIVQHGFPYPRCSKNVPCRASPSKHAQQTNLTTSAHAVALLRSPRMDPDSGTLHQ